MEAVVRPLTWEEWRDESRQIFQDLRSEAGEEMVLEKNLFIEGILPSAVLRDLTEEEMNVYRRPYLEPGESRRPTLTWPQELPINGEPEDVVSIVDDYSEWLAQSDVPKLFVNAEPGAILTGSQREFCRAWPNQEEVTVRGGHFVQEDSPAEIGGAVATRRHARSRVRAARDRGGSSAGRGRIRRRSRSAECISSRRTRRTRLGKPSP